MVKLEGIQISKNVPYSSISALNVLNVCLVDSQPAPSKLWVIYLHGGAWRDPDIGASSFDPAQDLLLTSGPARAHIAGLASIDYRLSPYPGRQNDPVDPDDPSRNASHPDHIDDVLTAISFLQHRYGFTSNYLLTGHSCGATMALQVVMSRSWSRTGPSSQSAHPTTPRPAGPIAVVGVAGIYDIPAIVQSHHNQPIYEEFVRGAFGPRFQAPTPGSCEVDVWANCSPTSGDYQETTWPEGRYVMIAHSREDELIGWNQVDLIEKHFEQKGYERWANRQGNYSGNLGDRRLEIYAISAKHDEVWGQGAELARALSCAILRTAQLPDIRDTAATA